MKLSVIVPIYNVEKYIKKCIFSVLKCDIDSIDYEIIVVDDESPDGSLEIVNEIAKQFTNIKVISQKNKGLGGARNTGVVNSSGDYLLFLDSDDWILPNTLSNILDVAYNTDVDVLEFSAQGIDEYGNVIYHCVNDSKGRVYDGVHYYNHIRYMNSACNKLYRRQFLIRESLFFKEQIFIEDFEFNTRVFFKAEKVIAVPNLVAMFLQSKNSITRNNNISKKDKMYSDFIKIIKITNIEYRKNLNLNQEQNSFFMERQSFLVTTLFFQFFKNKLTYQQISEYKNQLQEMELFFINFPIYQKNKDIFRRLMLKNFWFFKITQPLLKLI